MRLGHFEKETVTHNNENTLQVYRHKFVHFLFNAKTLSSNTFRMGEISIVTSPNSGSNYILKNIELMGPCKLSFQRFR